MKINGSLDYVICTTNFNDYEIRFRHYKTDQVFSMGLNMYFLTIYFSCCVLFLPWATSRKIIAPEVKLDIICLADSQHDSQLIKKCLYFTNIPPNSSIVQITGDSISLQDDEIRAIGLECKAPYPVEWTHNQEKWNTLTSTGLTVDIEIETFSRKIISLTDVASYQYYSLLFLPFIDLDFSVGQYSCRGVFPPTNMAHKEISIFQEGNIYDKAFPLSGKTVTVWMGENSASVTFPCYTINANINVSLFKEGTEIMKRGKLSPIPIYNFGQLDLHRILMMSTTGQPETEIWKKISTTTNLIFKPELGFIYYKSYGFTTTTLTLSPGVYKCVSDDDDTDFVVIKLESGYKPASPPIDEPLIGNASLKSIILEKHLIKVECCSSSAMPPKLFIVPCWSRTSCEKQMRHFSNPDFRIQSIHTSMTVNGSCTNGELVPLVNKYLITATNVRCIGDGINYSKTHIPALVIPNLIYTSWEEVDPYQMMNLVPENVNWDNKEEKISTVIAYISQHVKFTCHIRTDYFSSGAKVSLDLINGTQILLKDPPIFDEMHVKWVVGGYSLVITLDITKNIKSISCHAPIRNSQQWTTKTILFKVQGDVNDGIPVRIIGTTDVEVYATLGDKGTVLMCEVTGIPMSETVLWFKDHQQILQSNGLYNLSIQSNVSTLTIHKAAYEVQGKFMCVANNFYGNATKLFHVYVRAAETMWTLLSVSVGLVSFLCIFIILIYLSRREQQILNALKQPLDSVGGSFRR